MGYHAMLPSYAERVSAVRSTQGVQTPARAATVANQRPAAGAVATESRGLMAGGLGAMSPKANSPTAYLMLLVLIEAFALAGLRHGFRHYHGG